MRRSTTFKMSLVIAGLALVATACASAGDNTGAAAAGDETDTTASEAPAETATTDGSTTSDVAADPTAAGLDPNVAIATEDWPTDWSKRTIELDSLLLGIGRRDPRDAIPPIDLPNYESVEEAAAWLTDREPGAVVQVEGDVRFYPLSIMTRHEIVNDEVGGIPLAITFCPLCNTAIAFDRRVDDQVLRFGVSGLLRNSDLVMWDDATTSLWQQITGEAIVGDFAGTRLTPVSTAIASFGDFRASFPDGRSLSQDTGFPISYGVNPYAGYSSRQAPFIPVTGEIDDRFPALERVVGVSLEDGDRAYPFSVISEFGAVNDVIGETPIVVFWGSPDTADALDATVIAESQGIGTAIAYSPVVDGQVLTFRAEGDAFTDAETGSTWTILGKAVDGPLAGQQLETVNHRNEFWFAWSAFFSEAEVFAG